MAFLSIDAAPIQSFSGSTDEEIWAANMYEQVRKSELSSHYWNFNIAYSTLSRTVNTPTDAGWDYEFLPPNDVLRYVQMLDSNGTQIDYEDARGRVYSNSDTLIAKYQRDLSESDFPPYFIDALVARIAAEASETLSGEDRMVERMWGLYNTKHRKARRIDARNNPSRPFITDRNSTLIRNRFGGSLIVD
jgi:hypothetical protein